jgi:hypothetical protein
MLGRSPAFTRRTRASARQSSHRCCDGRSGDFGGWFLGLPGRSPFLGRSPAFTRRTRASARQSSHRCCDGRRLEARAGIGCLASRLRCQTGRFSEVTKRNLRLLKTAGFNSFGVRFGVRLRNGDYFGGLSLLALLKSLTDSLSAWISTHPSTATFRSGLGNDGPEKYHEDPVEVSIFTNVGRSAFTRGSQIRAVTIWYLPVAYASLTVGRFCPAAFKARMATTIATTKVIDAAFILAIVRSVTWTRNL